MAGAPVGNQNGLAKRERAFTEVLARVLLADKGKKLRRMADVLVNRATKGRGDLQAIKEIADRFEGRPRQQIEHTGLDDGPIDIEFTLRERARRIAFVLGAGAANDPMSAVRKEA